MNFEISFVYLWVNAYVMRMTKHAAYGERSVHISHPAAQTGVGAMLFDSGDMGGKGVSRGQGEGIVCQ